jgi:neutral ceramidase
MHGCRIGVGRVDITPDNAGATLGWGPLGRKDASPPTEPDQRLFVTAVALEDSAGERAVLVAADLHAGGAHLWRSAVDASGLDPSRVVMFGTHSHAGPTQRYGAPLYTIFAGASVFAPWASTRRLSPLVKRAVTEALRSLTPGAVAVTRGIVREAASNRAAPAWSHYSDRDRASFLMSGPGASIGAEEHPSDHLRDPRVTVLVARSDDGKCRAAIAWFAVHGTSLGAKWPAFGADLWGVARAEAEIEGTIVGFGGGSSGDISPLPLDGSGHRREAANGRPVQQGRALAEATGEQLGRVVRSCLTSTDPAPFSLGLAHRMWDPRSSGLPRPVIGMAMGGGGVDGPSEKWAEVEGGVRSLRYQTHRKRAYSLESGQGPKISLAYAYTSIPIPVDFLVGLLSPRRLPLHVVRVGDHVFAAVPGEPTTMTGWRIERAVAAAAGAASASVMGFAGDYAGYWATPEEYLEQRYEGASTIFGRNAATELVAQLSDLARQTAVSATP